MKVVDDGESAVTIKIKERVLKMFGFVFFIE